MGKKRPGTIQEVHKVYGYHTGQICKRCRYLGREFHRSQMSLRCIHPSIQGADWRPGWTACGKFEIGQSKIIEVI